MIYYATHGPTVFAPTYFRVCVMCEVSWPL